MVYLREAHPIDGRSSAENERRGIWIPQHKVLGERVEAAQSCAQALKLPMPMVVDGMDDRVGSAYGGWPDRLYIVGTDGRIAYRGDRGPMGFDVNEMERKLKAILSGKASEGKSR